VSASALAVVGLGASLGERAQSLRLATAALGATPGVRLLRASRIHRTPPWGGVARGFFLNAAVLLRSALPPLGLMERCQAIERRLGRRPGLRWGDRAIDLDLLWVEGVVLDDPRLVLPHPQVAARAFVLLPFEEVLPGAANPRSGLSFLQEHRALGPSACLPRPVAVGILAGPRPRKADS